MRSIGRRAAVALAPRARGGLPATAGWAVAEMEGEEALSEAADDAAMNTPPEEAAVAAPTGKVARSAFTSEIADREPVDQITADMRGSAAP